MKKEMSKLKKICIIFSFFCIFVAIIINYPQNENEEKSISKTNKTNEINENNEDDLKEIREIDRKYLIQGAGSPFIMYDKVFLMKDFYNFLKEKTDNAESSNVFGKRFVFYFENITEKNDFEMDSVALFSHRLIKDNLYSQSKLNRIKKIWKIGYDKDNNVIAKDIEDIIKSSKNIKDFMYGNERAIVILYSGQDNKDHYIIGYIRKYTYNNSIKTSGDVYDITLDDSGFLKGIDINSDKGKYKHKKEEFSHMDGLPYESVSLNDFTEILKKYEIIVDLYDIYGEYKYNPYKENKKEEDEPKIGMTKNQVLNSSWGEPKSKNITQTKYGVHEQWVYSNNRYIYFDNEIVTSIQKSE